MVRGVSDRENRLEAISRQLFVPKNSTRIDTTNLTDE